MVSFDQAFCTLMQAEHRTILGRLVLDVTAPADREECREAIERLCRSGTPFKLAKRFIRDDQSLVWVTNTVSMMQGANGPGMIVATVDPLIADDHRQPARLLDSARFLELCKDDRATVCDTSLFPDTAWDAILAAYVAEAEGQSITVRALAERLRIPGDRAGRWIGVLLGQGVIEIETRKADAYSPKCFRLTALTHRRLEEHLSRINLLAPGRGALRSGQM